MAIECLKFKFSIQSMFFFLAITGVDAGSMIFKLLKNYVGVLCF